ncbi:adenylate/guanylate cyclase domain-containing protein [Pseudactinotalea sp.]|uniref:adenylate/guanylate cyclase domain-containing protein n=1 Tax=Pseudactinotalea sp. TaxID=1926260 RepID=UPI003B3B14E2
MVEEADSAGSTYQELARTLLGDERTLTTLEVAERTGQSVQLLRGFWRSLGFADVPDDVPHFTEGDVAVFVRMAALVEEGTVGLNAAQTLVRAQGHSADRLALWQLEALVEDAAARYRLDDTSARLVVLDRLAALVPVLEQQMVHTWRRQLVALLGRLDRDIARAHAPQPPENGELPLERAVGFLDMVSFTERTAGLTPAALADLVQSFETAARDTIAGNGARVVKTIGDAVLFVADDLRTGAEVALQLLEVMSRAGFEVRGGLVWGRVLSLSGDVFGPSVNLASRLGDVAPAGAVVLDDVSAALLEASEPGVTLSAQAPVAVQGLGVVRPVRLGRAHHDDGGGPAAV